MHQRNEKYNDYCTTNNLFPDEIIKKAQFLPEILESKERKF